MSFWDELEESLRGRRAAIAPPKSATEALEYWKESKPMRLSDLLNGISEGEALQSMQYEINRLHREVIASNQESLNAVLAPKDNSHFGSFGNNQQVPTPGRSGMGFNAPTITTTANNTPPPYTLDPGSIQYIYWDSMNGYTYPDSREQETVAKDVCPKCSSKAELKVFSSFQYYFCPNCREDISVLAKA